jgi:hypothetical protein
MVKGVVLDAGAQTVMPVLRPKRALIFGDSITEGIASQCHAAPTCTEHSMLCSAASTKTWGTAVAAALDAEYSQVGFGGLGWVVSGGGGVVPFFTPNDDAKSSWNKVSTRGVDCSQYIALSTVMIIRVHHTKQPQTVPGV